MRLRNKSECDVFLIREECLSTRALQYLSFFMEEPRLIFEKTLIPIFHCALPNRALTKQLQTLESGIICVFTNIIHKNVVYSLISIPRLKALVFCEVGFDDKCAKALSEVFRSGVFTDLTNMHFPRNKITGVGMNHLSEGLDFAEKLHSLDLSYNACGDAGAFCIADFMSRSTSLRALSLRGNGIGPQGAAAIASALAKQSQIYHRKPHRCGGALQLLQLCRNSVSDAGATDLAHALETNQALDTMDLSLNGITIAGSRALAASLRSNQTLRVLTVLTAVDNPAEADELIAMRKTFVHQEAATAPTLDM